MAATPPERIELEGAIVRRETAEDAPAIAKAIGVNRERLAVWMDWATPEAADADVQVERIAESNAQWSTRSSFDYIIVDAAGVVLGKISFPRRYGSGTLELGYWLTAEAEGRGIATAAASALTAAGLAVDGVDRIEIHCDEANVRSAAIPERLGYRLDRTVDHPVSTTGQTGRQMIWMYPARLSVR